MADRIDVINSALRRIGASRISDPNEDVKNANVARDIYEDILEDLLRSNFWNFATRRQELSQLTEVPTFEFDYAYALPSDWIRTVSVHPNGDGYQSTIKYKEENVGDQNVILASTEQLFMRYIAMVSDVNLWAADFKQAMILALARDLAIPISSSNELREQMDTAARKALARARSTDAMGSTPERRPDGTWKRNRGTQRPVIGDTVN